MVFLGVFDGLRATAGQSLHLTSLSCLLSLGLWTIAQDCYAFVKHA